MRLRDLLDEVSRCEVVVVHCNSGVHRAPQVCAGLMALARKMPYVEADTQLQVSCGDFFSVSCSML